MVWGEILKTTSYPYSHKRDPVVSWASTPICQLVSGRTIWHSTSPFLLPCCYWALWGVELLILYCNNREVWVSPFIPFPCDQWGPAGAELTAQLRSYKVMQVHAALSLEPGVELSFCLTWSAIKHESLLPFCLSEVGGAQKEAEHTHSPCPHAAPQQENCLPKQD